MIDLALYAVAVLGGTAGLFGHTPILSGLAREMWAAAASYPSRGLRVAPGVPQGSDDLRDHPAPQSAARAHTGPRWAHKPHDYEETA